MIDQPAMPPDDKHMPLMEHLVELRKRLILSVLAYIVAFSLCYYVSHDIYNILVRPLAGVLADKGGNHRMIYTALTEAFFTYIKVAAFAAALVCFPVWAGQLWAFVAPGLYQHERRAFAPYLVATPVLFIAGGVLVYYVVLPLALGFFASFESFGGDTGGLPIQLEAKISDYLSLVMKMIFGFGLAFQMPVVLTLLARVGIITSDGLKTKRRFAIVGIFIAAAILTPPDVLSQLSLAVPMLLLYELSIISCKMVEQPAPVTEVDDRDAQAAGLAMPSEAQPAATGEGGSNDIVPPPYDDTDFNQY